MESEELLARLRSYMSIDQEFYHVKFMDKARKVKTKEDLIEIIDLLHSNYLVRVKLFSNLARRVAEDGYELPPLDELIKH